MGGKLERIDYNLTAKFAKKLCMVSKSVRGEEARNYFIKVEDVLKSKTKQEQINNLATNMLFAEQLKNVTTIMSGFIINNDENIQGIRADFKKETEEIKNMVKEKNNNIDEIKEMIGFRSRNTKSLSVCLKDKLTLIHGFVVMASDSQYIRAKRNMFREFEVDRWEQMPVSTYNSVYAYIDSLEM